MRIMIIRIIYSLVESYINATINILTDNKPLFITVNHLKITRKYFQKTFDISVVYCYHVFTLLNRILIYEPAGTAHCLPTKT